MLMQASHQWMKRPEDERFTSLDAMQAHFRALRERSKGTVVANRVIQVAPSSLSDPKALVLVGPKGVPATMTHWSFSQLAQLADSPAGYLRSLPAAIAADCLNYHLQFTREVEDVGLLIERRIDNVTMSPAHGLQGDLSATIRAATGPKYGRIWNADVLNTLVDRFGDGVSGDWRVPGEFGKAVKVTKANTTLFAGDRDMFVFLCDERNRIDVPGRGAMARGFFLWNSEVGKSLFGLASFLFDYVCCNRIVWGPVDYQEVKIRHTASAPEKFLEQMTPALQAFATSSASSVVKAITQAREARIQEDVSEFLAKRFGKRAGVAMQQLHMAEEGKPVETLWDATTAATAFARSIQWQDARVEVERKAGQLLNLAA